MTSFFTDPTQVGTFNSDGALVMDYNRPADKLRQQAAVAYDRIRSSSLSPDAQRILIAGVYSKLVDDMSALQQSTGTASAADVASLKRQVFGIDDVLGSSSPVNATSALVAFRDAQDRVSTALMSSGDTSRTLNEILDQADMSGDETLAQAAFNAAATGGLYPDQELIDRFLTTRPAKARAYESLGAAQRPKNAAELFQWVTPTPPELQSLPLGTSVASLAAQAPVIRAAAAAASSI